MLPLKDLNPTRRVPVITYALVAINVVVFLWELLFSAPDLL
jgi:membrane associated rhomboid family serine protease